MEKYEKYKDSGIEWIGDIPEHWVVEKLGRQGFFTASGIDKKTVKGEPIVKMINYTDVYGNKDLTLNADKNYMVVTCPETKKEVHQVSIGDLIFTPSSETIDEIGISALVVEEMPDTVYSYHVIRLRFAKEFDVNFRKYLCNNNFVLNQFSRKAKGTTRQIIGRDVFKSIKVVIPPKQEQTVIANYLDQKTTQIDQLIAQKEQLLNLYEEEKTAIINQAVTKGINPNVKLKDSGVDWLGEIPEHWEVKKLKYVGDFINGYSFKSKDFQTSGVRILKISNIQHMHIDWKDASFVDEELYEEYTQFRIYKDDLVFALTRPIISTGIKASLIKTDEKILINQRNSVFRTDSISINWIYYILLSENFIQEFDKRIDKTGQQPNISSNDIGNINIPIPSSDEFELLISFIKTENEKINTKAEKIKKFITLLKEYKTALISEVVTGKIKVI